MHRCRAECGAAVRLGLSGGAEASHRALCTQERSVHHIVHMSWLPLGRSHHWGSWGYEDELRTLRGMAHATPACHAAWRTQIARGRRRHHFSAHRLPWAEWWRRLEEQNVHAFPMKMNGSFAASPRTPQSSAGSAFTDACAAAPAARMHQCSRRRTEQAEHPILLWASHPCTVQGRLTRLMPNIGGHSAIPGIGYRLKCHRIRH